MSTTCLVTKLKNFIDNDNLPYLGGLTVKFGDNTANNAGINTNVVDEIMAKNGTFSIYYENELRYSGLDHFKLPIYSNIYYNIVPEVSNMSVVLFDKYNTNRSSIFVGNANKSGIKSHETYFDVSQLYGQKVSVYATTIKLSGVFDVSKMDYISSQIYITDSTPDFEFFVPEDFKMNSNLTAVDIRKAKCTCNITAFDNCKDITILTITSPYTHGSLSDVADTLYNNGQGKTSGDVKYFLGGTQCTFTDPDTGITKTINQILNEHPGFYGIKITFAPSGWSYEITA